MIHLIDKIQVEPTDTGNTVISVALTEGQGQFYIEDRIEYVINENWDNHHVSYFMALSVFKDLAEHFEEWQDHGWGAETSFSEEDLPSNLIGFYIAMYEHMGFFHNPKSNISQVEQQFVRQVCDCVDHFVDSPYGWRSLEAFDVYDDAWRKVHDWNDAHLDFDDGCFISTFCGMSPRSWPAQLGWVSTWPKGREVGYFWEYDKSIDGRKGKKLSSGVWQLKDD